MPKDLSPLGKFKIKLKLLHDKLARRLPKFRKVAELLLIAACVPILMLVFTMFSAKAPEYHDMYLRATVGSKVYKIMADLRGGGGTGFQIKAPSGTSYIMTNSHVCQYIEDNDSADNKQTVLVVGDDGEYVKRRIVAISDKTDLCLVEGMPGVEGMSLGHEPDIGEHMVIVGHPHLKPVTLSAGDVIGTEDVQIMDFIIKVKDNPFVEMLVPTNPDGKCDMPKNQIKAIPIPKELGGGEIDVCLTNTMGAYMTAITIYPGNSGSPMVDFFGKVCGVAFAADGSDNYGYAVSFDDLQTFLAKY